jgi:hypothetical protein
MSDFYHERVSIADIDSGELPVEMIAIMRFKLDQAFARQSIVPVQPTWAIAAVNEAYQAGYRKGLDDAVYEFNKRGGEQLDKLWLEIRFSMNSLLDVAQCNPGPDTNKTISDLSSDLIKHLDEIDSLLRQQLSRPGNIFFDMTDEGVAALKRVRGMRENTKHFFDMGGADKALAWFREVVKRDYLDLEQAISIAKVKSRGRGRKGVNVYIVERGEQIAEALNLPFDRQGFITIGKEIFDELHPIAKILDKKGNQWKAYAKIKECNSLGAGGELSWNEKKLYDVIRNAMRDKIRQNNFDEPLLPSETAKDGLL